MALLNKNLSEREKAAIHLHIYGGVNNWPLLYRIAVPDSFPDESLKGLSDLASKWKRSPKIQTYLQTVQEQKFLYEQKIKAAAIETGDNVRTNSDMSTQKEKNIDYSDPANQARKLNELVNSADDPGEALDALKVIISTQKADREAARDKKAVGAYVPITCYDCPLYLEAKNKLSK